MMKSLFSTLCAVLFITLTGCGETRRSYTVIDGFAQGSTFHIVYYDSLGRDLRPEIEEFLEAFDQSLSVYNPNSLLSRINRNDPDAVPDEWFTECFAISQQISEQTGGIFDITVRPLVQAYKIGLGDSAHVLTQHEIDSMLQFTGFRKVRIEDGRLIKDDPRIELDFNAIAQGYSADLTGKLLESHGIHNYLVEIGGEIICKGRNRDGNEWRVGIDKPFEGNTTPGKDLQTIIRLTDAGLVTSGNYRKFAFDEQGNKVTHTLDPFTGKPARHSLLSATIIAPTSAIADGYATACMALGLEKSIELMNRRPELEAYLVYGDEQGAMAVWMTESMRRRIVENERMK